MSARLPFSFAIAACSALACAVLSVSGVAHASDNYPALVQSELALSQRPECTLCHADLVGGTGTVVKPFGLTMQDFGARGKDPTSLQRALQSDRDNDVDSDGDEIADIAELSLGTDPNDGPGRQNAVERPQRGCALARIGAGNAQALAAWPVALWCALCEMARRRRSRDARPVLLKCPDGGLGSSRAAG
jgi:hypothetical protein